MKITTLIENRADKASPNLKGEWGLSLSIIFNDRHVIFDTGATDLFAKNAEHLSINLASVDAAVLSHHHFDHAGGIRRFFEINPTANLHLGKAPGIMCYGKLLFLKKYIGIDQTLFTQYPDRFIFDKEPVEILPDVFILPHISGPYPKPPGNKRLCVKQNGKLVRDDFSHEIVMAIKENNGLVIFTGCAHNGILNLVDTVAREFRGIPIRAVIGGFHLVGGSPIGFLAGGKREIEQLAQEVLDYPVEHTYTGHCTGNRAFAVLKGVMGERISDIMTGSSIEI